MRLKRHGGYVFAHGGVLQDELILAQDFVGAETGSGAPHPAPKLVVQHYVEE
jgi:hypothetical protein